jgi:hypothetical protein
VLGAICLIGVVAGVFLATNQEPTEYLSPAGLSVESIGESNREESSLNERARPTNNVQLDQTMRLGSRSASSPSSFFAEINTDDPDYLRAREEATVMLASIDSVVVGFNKIVATRPDSMESFLENALGSPGQFEEPFNLSLTSSYSPCLVESVRDIYELNEPGVYRIYTSCDSGAGPAQITILYDSHSGNMGITLANEDIDIQVAPIRNTSHALIYEVLKESYPTFDSVDRQ